MLSDMSGFSAGQESVVVKNNSFVPGKEVMAEVRGSIYVARALELNDGANNLTVTATDGAGNQKTYPASGYRKVNLDETISSITFSYDAMGNMTQRNDQGTTTTYVYNDANQLKQITFGATTPWLKFYYDGLGRRVKTEYNDGQTTTERRFVNLGGSIIRELNSSNVTVREYIRDGGLGGGIGSIIYCKESSSYYYYHYNHKGDVVSVTDANKAEVAYYEYDAWGNTMTEAGSWSSPYCFSTKERDRDGDSRLIHFGARYYSSEIGRWTQRDPQGTVDGLNLYPYVGNEPLNSIDPWGDSMEAGWSPSLDDMWWPKPDPQPEWTWVVVEGETVYVRASFATLGGGWETTEGGGQARGVRCGFCTCSWNVVVEMKGTAPGRRGAKTKTSQYSAVQTFPPPVAPIWPIGSEGVTASDYSMCWSLCVSLGAKKAQQYKSSRLHVRGLQSMGQYAGGVGYYAVGPGGSLTEIPLRPPSISVPRMLW